MRVPKCYRAARYKNPSLLFPSLVREPKHQLRFYQMQEADLLFLTTSLLLGVADQQLVSFPLLSYHDHHQHKEN